MPFATEQAAGRGDQHRRQAEADETGDGDEGADAEATQLIGNEDGQRDGRHDPRDRSAEHQHPERHGEQRHRRCHGEERGGYAHGRGRDGAQQEAPGPGPPLPPVGGDAAADRTGVRTDSMTLASVDTETGDTVLLSLPRNLERFQMPPGPARDRFPYGFTGDGPLNPGLLNEVYEYAEQHPDVVPGVPKNHRGPELLKATIAGILGLRVDYYILVDMFGFADIVDAMGGVRLKITEPIPYGQQGAVLQPGYRKLGGKEALWYGRSRTNSSDYVRMGRQKCLMRAIAEQADPQTVLTSFDKLAAAAKRTLATDIPQELLPALVKLSNKVKDGAGIRSLQFVPPLIYTGNPDFKLIRKLASEAVNSDPRAVSASGSPSASPSGPESPSSGAPGTSSSPKPDTKPVSLEDSCP